MSDLLYLIFLASSVGTSAARFGDAITMVSIPASLPPESYDDKHQCTKDRTLLADKNVEVETDQHLTTLLHKQLDL